MDRRVVLSGLLVALTALVFVSPAPAVSHNDFAPSMVDPYTNLCDVGACSPLFAVISLPQPNHQVRLPVNPIIRLRTPDDTANSPHSMMAAGDVRGAALGAFGGGQVLASSGAAGRGATVSPLAVRQELESVLRQLDL